MKYDWIRFILVWAIVIFSVYYLYNNLYNINIDTTKGIVSEKIVEHGNVKKNLTQNQIGKLKRDFGKIDNNFSTRAIQMNNETIITRVK